MKMYEVKSSNVKEIGWENEILKVTFKNGKSYFYHELPYEMFVEALNSESIGKFLNQNVYGKFIYSMPIKQEEGGDENGKI